MEPVGRTRAAEGTARREAARDIAPHRRFRRAPRRYPFATSPQAHSRNTGRKRLDASIEGRRCGCPAHGPRPAAPCRRAGRRRRLEGQGEGRARTDRQVLDRRADRERQAARLRPDGPRQVRAQGQARQPPPPGGGVVKGASWTGGGPVVQRTGKVLFTMDGGNWVCSASAISRQPLEPLPGPDRRPLRLRRGQSRRSRRTGRTSPRSIPRRRSPAPSRPSAAGPPPASSSTTATRPRAASTPRPRSTTSRSRSSGRAARRNTQLDALGTYGISYPAISTGGSVHSFGYPAAGKYKGKDLTYCAGPTFNDHLQRQPDLGHRLQHDRRLVRRPVARPASPTRPARRRR